jgi:hypothetical protein
MLKYRQKNFLNDLLSVLNRQSKTQQVSEQPVSPLVEEINHVLLQSGRGSRPAPLTGCSSLQQ